MNETAKIVLLSAAGFAILTAANVASQAIYTHSKIGVDKKGLAISAAIGIGVSYALMKYYKK
jgi:hypothetical protein